MTAKGQGAMGEWTARLFLGLAVVVSACGGAPAKSEMPTELLPAALPRVEASTAEQVLRIRVYAGSAYRARIMGWDAELEQVLTATSAILQEACATQLELVESIDWKLAGGKLSASLESLRSFDQGVEVDLVLGLIDADTELQEDYSQLMATDSFGKHIVLRSFNRMAESAALPATAQDLDEATKDRLLDRRRRHKQAMILARAIATNFGAPATGAYDFRGSKLDTETAEILRITIAATLRAASSEKQSEVIWGEASESLALLGLPDKLVALARQQGLIRNGEVPKETKVPLRNVDRDTIAKVKTLAKDGSAAEAWQKLEPLTELYPDHLEIVELACRVGVARGGADAMERCRAAIALNPDNAQTWLRIGMLQLSAKDGAALQSLKKAHGALGDGEKGWMSLARSYRQLSLPTLALEAAKRADAKPDTSLMRWALETRSRYGSMIGVESESEARYLVALKAALKLVYKNEYKAANLAAADLRSSFPKSIAGDLVHCEIGLRRRKYDAAKRSCNAVLSRQSGNAWARYLLGVVSQRTRAKDKAIEFWNAAIQSDPGLKAAYEALAKVYRKSADPRLAALRKQYKGHFGVELK